MYWYLVVVGLAQAVVGADILGVKSALQARSTGRAVDSNLLNSVSLPSSRTQSKDIESSEDTWSTLTALASDLMRSDQPKIDSSLEDTEEGRKMRKKKRLLLSLLVGMKVLAAGIILPSILALALYASWKGVTISLLAFMLAATVGVKALLSKSTSGKEEKHHVIVAKPAPSLHEHIWRKDEDWYEKDHSPYRAYSSRQYKN